ncbi:phospholipase effector Tle1 domain-containing protein [Arcobacter sp. LA11]|uniref:phospholipase effector Tle1 domain-containing protein n=1 Tax=Arcobacter sp. LA11 TaxID=1898176 RepID=UPI000933D8D4|nr:DUF2235 domain-containing protein [Arcobacter sp. LA11]
MSNSCKKGAVYFQYNEALHLAEFLTKKGKPCIDTNRTRWVFIIINKKETESLCPNEDNKQKVLEEVVDEYSSYLLKAVKKEANPNNQILKFSNLRGSNEIEVEKKLLKTQSASLYGSKSYGTVLKQKKYTYAYNNELPEDKKINDKEKTTSTLDYTKLSCQKVLDKEQMIYKLNNSKEENSSYIIISMPYVYNYKKGSNEELEVTTYENRISASYMPEIKVEYGVFFDGTKNNMYNIDFYRNYKKFLEKPCNFIIDNKDKDIKKYKKNTPEEYSSIQEYIAADSNPKKNQNIMVMLQEQILSHGVRYFDEKSNEISKNEKKENNKYDDSTFWQAKISNHAEKVFDYLLDVKNDDEDKLGQDSGQNKFLYKKILPGDDGDGSFTNGETNINRLYKLYNGDDLKTYTDLAPVTRFKVYASGSGTSDVFENEDYDADSIVGLGLGIGDTGVKAHIIYTCQKIADQLRTASIFNIDELIFDTFGFSRGAASARHFVCSIVDKYEITKEEGKRKYTLDTKNKEDIFACFFEKEDGLYTRVGNKVYFNPLRVDKKQVVINAGRTQKVVKNPYYKKEKINIESISFRFVGIYDTVTHYGAKQSNDHKDLNIDFTKNKNDKKFGHVTHMMAEDEYRYNFDAYSIFETNYKYHHHTNEKGNIEEFIIPGAHADVGGGYNEKDELVYLGRSDSNINTIKKKIKSWNNKFVWLENNNIKEISNKVYLKKDDLKEENDGFYITFQNMSEFNISSFYHIYMYKKMISNKYEHVCLKFMHDKAIKNKDNLEEVPLSSPDKIYKFDGTLKKVYDKIISLEKINTDKELYKKLKDDYIHHSSKVADFVNKPSMENKSKAYFYGQRVVYGITGNVFTN